MEFNYKMFSPYLLEIISNLKRKRVRSVSDVLLKRNQGLLEACSPENETIRSHRPACGGSCPSAGPPLEAEGKSIWTLGPRACVETTMTL